MPVTNVRPHSASTASSQIKEHLKCIFSRSTRPTTPVLGKGRGRARSAGLLHHNGTVITQHLIKQHAAMVAQQQQEYNKLQKAKKRRSSQLGHEEEKRIMRILHNLQSVEKKGSSLRLREELTQLYIKPLPEYIQNKLRQHEEKGMTRSAILFEELFERSSTPCTVSVEDNDNSTSAEKIQLPERKPQITSRWQQKMLTKLEKMDTSSNNYSSNPKPAFQPHLNRQLQVQGQGSSCSTKLQTPRYKPPIPSASSPPFHPPRKPKQTSFPYVDPLPQPVSYISSKDTLSPFEERILELEKMERDSIAIERTAKSKFSSKEATSRVPSTFSRQSNLGQQSSRQSNLAQQNSRQSSLALQSKLPFSRKTSSTTGSVKSRTLTPTNGVNSYRRKTSSRAINEQFFQQKKKGSKLAVPSKSLIV